MGAARRLARLAATLTALVTIPFAFGQGAAADVQAVAAQTVADGCYRAAAYDPVEDVVWTIRSTNNCVNDRLQSYDVGSATFGPSVAVADSAVELAVASDGQSVYVAAWNGTVSRYAVPSMTLLSQFALPGGPGVSGLWASPTDPTVVVVMASGAQAFTATGTALGAIVPYTIEEVSPGVFVARFNGFVRVTLETGGLVVREPLGAGGTLPLRDGGDGNWYSQNGVVIETATWTTAEDLTNTFEEWYVDPYSNDIYARTVASTFVVVDRSTKVVKRLNLTAPLPGPLAVPAGPGVAVEPTSLGLTIFRPGAFTRSALPSVGAPVAHGPGLRRTAGIDSGDMAYDPVRRLVYAGTSKFTASNGGAVFQIDATTGRILERLAVGSTPDQLALSSDGSTLYVSIETTGEVVRVDAPSLTEELRFRPTGAATRTSDLAAVPGRPDSFAAAIRGVVTIYDGDVARTGRAPGNWVSPGRSSNEMYVACQLHLADSCSANPCDFSPNPADCPEPLRILSGVVRMTIGPSGFPVIGTKVKIAAGVFVLPDRTVWGTGRPSGLTAVEASRLPAYEAPRALFDPATRRLISLEGSTATIETLDPRARIESLPLGIGDPSSPGNAALIGSTSLVALTADGLLWGTITDDAHHEGEFVPVTPARILDTRDGTGRSGSSGPLGPDTAISLSATAPLRMPAADVNAVVLTATVTGPTAAGYLTVYPSGVARPTISNLNFSPGDTIPNLVTVPVGPDGRIKVYNPYGRSHVILDVLGYYTDVSGPAGARFRALDVPERVLDTRSGTGTGGSRTPVAADGSIRLNLTKAFTRLGADFDQPYIRAVLLNVTVAEASSPTYVTVYEDGIDRPTVSNLNPTPGKVSANQVIAGVSPGGALRLYNAAGDVHLVADLVGYYIADYTVPGGRFVPFVPERAFDTRVDAVFPSPGAIPADAALYLPTQSTGLYDAFVFNATATGATEPTYIAALPWTGDQTPPRGMSSLNVVPGQTVANHVTIKVRDGVAFWNRYGSVHVIGDVFGGFLKDDTWEQATGQTVGATTQQSGDAQGQTTYPPHTVAVPAGSPGATRSSE